MHILEKNKKIIPIFLLIFTGVTLRFYKLDWGQGLFTHPDEYHIVGSVTQLSFPVQMNPHFFSYGTVTIYLIYFTQELLKYISLILNTFLIGRFYSALFSTLTIFIAYKICTNFFTKRVFALIAAFLVAITPGLIQQAHFATPESAQIFFLFSSLLFMIKFVKRNKILFLALACALLGFAMGVKISSAVFLAPLIITIFIASYSRKIFLKTLVKFIELIGISAIIIVATFALVAPFVFLDFPAFRSNLEYEGGLAMGKFPVFYTRQFTDTIPVLFQMEKILPYTLGPFLLLLGVLGFLNVMLNSFQHLVSWVKTSGQAQNDKRITLIIVIAFLSLFIPNAFLFTKWTRFISPTFPFFAIFACFLLDKVYLKSKSISKLLTYILLIGTFLWTTAFFSIYLNPDVRITASNWMEKNFPENSTILVEGGNMIDVPLKENFKKISLDFYNLETDIQTKSTIAAGLEGSDYFLIQSRRVFMNYQRLPKLYPKTASFYNALFAGKMGFTQIKEFHSYPQLEIGNWKLEITDEGAEETWSVFDHPVIRVFKKTKQLSTEDYAKFLEIK